MYLNFPVLLSMSQNTNLTILFSAKSLCLHLSLYSKLLCYFSQIAQSYALWLKPFEEFHPKTPKNSPTHFPNNMCKVLKSKRSPLRKKSDLKSYKQALKFHLKREREHIKSFLFTLSFFSNFLEQNLNKLSLGRKGPVTQG